jgi:hypothetical protein
MRRTQAIEEEVMRVLTPMWARDEDAVSIVANSVDHILDCVSSSCREHDMFWLDSVNWIEVGVEEGG